MVNQVIGDRRRSRRDALPAGAGRWSRGTLLGALHALRQHAGKG